MTTLPDIPRLYTALAEVLAALMYAHSNRRRKEKLLNTKGVHFDEKRKYHSKIKP